MAEQKHFRDNGGDNFVNPVRLAASEWPNWSFANNRNALLLTDADCQVFTNLWQPRVSFLAAPSYLATNVDARWH